MKKSTFIRGLTVIVGIVSLFVLIEVILGVFLGLGNPPLLVRDKNVGYYYKANQNLRRFGNKIFYNQYHQRSDPLLENPAYRILMIGDSVTNGGSLTDHKDLITEILERKLNKHKKTPGEVLNASAKSWGIENQYAYIKKFGIFDADIVIFQIGTNDFRQPKSFKLSRDWGINISTNIFPAISELIGRYIRPKFFKGHSNNRNVQQRLYSKKQFLENLECIKKIIRLVKKSGKMPVVLLTPNRREIGSKIILSEREEVITLLNKQRIAYINLFDKRFGLKNNHFRDEPHLGIGGNKFVAGVLFEYFRGNNLL